MVTAPAPAEIRVGKNRDRLHIAFSGGETFAFSAEFLRVMSPSAEVRGHAKAERKTVGGKRAVRIVSVEPVGNYAIRIGFDDGHATGLFSWDFLLENGRDMDRIWSDYLAELEAKGMDRDRPGMR